MKLEKNKKVKLNKIGRLYVEAEDLAYNGEKIRIKMNENFTKDFAKENLDKVVELDVYVEFEEKNGYWKITLHPVDLKKIEKEKEEKAILFEIDKMKKGINTMLYYVEKAYKEDRTYQNGIDVINNNLKEIEKLSKKDETTYIEKIKAELKRLKVVVDENNSLQQKMDFEEPFEVGHTYNENGKKYIVKKAWRDRVADALSFGGCEDNQLCYFALVEEIENSENEVEEVELVEKEIEKIKRYYDNYDEKEIELYIDFVKRNKNIVNEYRSEKDNHIKISHFLRDYKLCNYKNLDLFLLREKVNEKMSYDEVFEKIKKEFNVVFKLSNAKSFIINMKSEKEL